MNTVKLGDKEQLDNEQTGFKEHFTEHEIVKNSKKGGTLENF